MSNGVLTNATYLAWQAEQKRLREELAQRRKRLALHIGKAPIGRPCFTDGLGQTRVIVDDVDT